MNRGDIVLIGDRTTAWAKKGLNFDAETVYGVNLGSLRWRVCAGCEHRGRFEGAWASSMSCTF